MVAPPRSELILGISPPVAVPAGLLFGKGAALADHHGSGQTLVTAQGVVGTRWKLLIGDISQSGWTGPVFPNRSTDWIGGDAIAHCTDSSTGKRGCLYDLEADAEERHDVAAENPEIVEELLQRLGDAERSVFKPDRGEDTGEACRAAWRRGGYFGPFLDLKDMVPSVATI